MWGKQDRALETSHSRGQWPIMEATPVLQVKADKEVEKVKVNLGNRSTTQGEDS